MNASRLVTLSLILALGGPLMAQEFGINSSTSARLGSDPGAGFTLSQRLDGSFTLPFDLKGGGVSLKAHADAAYPLEASADLDELAVSFAYQQPATDLNALLWTLGRFTVSEPTGLILSHPVDGSALKFTYQGFRLNLAFGYTGFVLKSTSGVSLTLADQSSKSIFASPRLVGTVDASAAFAGHEFTLSGVAQQDQTANAALVPEWDSVYSADKGGRLDTQYLTLQAVGPIIDSLYYEAFATFGSGSTLSWLTDASSPTGYLYEYKPILSFLAGTKVSYYLPALLSSAFSARVLVASGDSDASSPVEGNTAGASTLFVPVTGTSLGTVFNPALSNLMYYELSATLKPLPGLPLVTGAKLLGFQRAVAGAVNAPGALRTGPSWMGEELDLTAAWQPLSDVSVTASVGAFIPTAGTFAPTTAGGGASFQYAARVGVNLSL